MTDDELGLIELRDECREVLFASFDRKALLAEVRRLRRLVGEAEFFQGDTAGWCVCNWCEAGIFDLHSNKREPHKPNCPAFTPEGKVR